jgi:hypothetical protein
VNERELPRWAESEEDLPGELRDWVRGGGAALGSAVEVAELRQRLVAALGPAAGLGGSEPPSGDSLREPTPAAREPVLRAPAPGAPSAPSALALGQRIGRWGWFVLGGVSIAAGVWFYARRPPVPDATPSIPPPALTSPAPEVAARPEESSRPPEPTTPRAQPLPPEPQRPLAGASSLPKERRAARSKPSSPPSLGEAALLERARDALRANPAAALALTREHDRHFPRGVLAEEREVIAIEALRRMGREAAAERRAAAFERRYRGSVHRQHMERPGSTQR